MIEFTKEKKIQVLEDTLKVWKNQLQKTSDLEKVPLYFSLGLCYYLDKTLTILGTEAYAYDLPDLIPELWQERQKEFMEEDEAEETDYWYGLGDMASRIHLMEKTLKRIKKG